MAYTKQPKYFDLMEELEQKILSGTYRAGDKLPSENELSRDYQVSRQTVRKALEILEEKGLTYARHGSGTFVSGMSHAFMKSKNIAVITTYLSDYIFPRVIQGVDQVLTEHGYSILLKNTRNSRSMEAQILTELLKKEIDGLIIEPSKSQIFCKHMNLYEELDAYRIPYVFIQGSYSLMKHKPHVLMDDCKGGYLVTRHLIEQGRKDILGIFKADDYQGQERHKGYVKALQESGIPYDPERVIWYYTEDRKSHPYMEISQCLSERENAFCDAVVCYNDQIAIDVIRALEEAGLECPNDVAVTGYDDSYLAQTCRIPLTTIAHPQEKLGQMAAELLLKLIRGEELKEEDKQIVIDPELIVRKSTTE